MGQSWSPVHLQPVLKATAQGLGRLGVLQLPHLDPPALVHRRHGPPVRDVDQELDPDGGGPQVAERDINLGTCRGLFWANFLARRAHISPHFGAKDASISASAGPTARWPRSEEPRGGKD